jgi:hypothetical protein
MDWEAYFNAALGELEAFRGQVIDPDWRDFLHAKIADAILMAVAQCEPPQGMGGIAQAMALRSLKERCKAKARG